MENVTGNLLMAGERMKKLLEDHPEMYKFKTNVLHIVDSNLYFLHIPKCGGTSVRDALIHSNVTNKKPKLRHLNYHNHSKALDLVSKINIKKCKFILSVRHPIGRFMSAYNFLLDIDLRNIERGIGDIEFYKKRKSYMEKIGFHGFCDLLLNEKDRLAVKQKYFDTEEFTHFDWAFELQSSWIEGVPDYNITAYKIEDGNIFKELGVQLFRSKMKNYPRNIKLADKDKIYKYFRKDFDRFDYHFSEQWDAHHLLNERIRATNLPAKVLKGFLGGIKIKKPKT